MSFVANHKKRFGELSSEEFVRLLEALEAVR